MLLCLFKWNHTISLQKRCKLTNVQNLVKFPKVNMIGGVYLDAFGCAFCLMNSCSYKGILEELFAVPFTWKKLYTYSLMSSLFQPIRCPTLSESASRSRQGPRQVSRTVDPGSSCRFNNPETSSATVQRLSGSNIILPDSCVGSLQLNSS